MTSDLSRHREAGDDQAARRLCALDSSTQTASIALLEGRRLLAELTVHASHSKSLLDDFHSLLERCGWPLTSISAFAVGIGPGSFTGVRIGMATLRALSWTLARPLLGRCSLEILAMAAAGRSGSVAAVMDARKGEVYLAAYDVSGVARGGGLSLPHQVVAPMVLSPEAALSRIAEIPRAAGEPLWLVGDGVLRYPEIFRPGEPTDLCIGGPAEAFPRAANLAWLAELALDSRDHAPPPLEVVPLYVRPSEAELGSQPAGRGCAPKEVV